ncbi:Oidioi.mRNA.OKI2018_I69.chr1.g1537.t1.cds [Oikopleura dioica]|uniref:Oidioi.mRNA.OKI2018_I69.chr1.g1537.t1.cds n=1 Tax=Oikopleura dioica TaxID=34765 RepID=A0ABN7STA8_OIKDI|nr:Oidioi.mRNA.OKI2018_I69.chr1.g1537.t1.cds [Oikopleura dioica]
MRVEGSKNNEASTVGNEQGQEETGGMDGRCSLKKWMFGISIAIFTIVMILIGLNFFIPQCYSYQRKCKTEDGIVWFAGAWKKTRDESRKYCEKAGFQLANISIAEKLFEERSTFFPSRRILDGSRNFWISDDEYSRNFTKIKSGYISTSPSMAYDKSTKRTAVDPAVLHVEAEQQKKKRKWLIGIPISLVIVVLILVGLNFLFPLCFCQQRKCKTYDGMVWFADSGLKTREESRKFCENLGFQLANVSIAESLLGGWGHLFDSRRNYWIYDRDYKRNITSGFNKMSSSMAYDSHHGCITFLRADQALVS